MRKENCFVNIENIFAINEFEGLLKVSLGSYDRSEHKYILFKDKKVKYFPNNLLPVKDNFDAHNLLIGYLKGL